MTETRLVIIGPGDPVAGSITINPGRGGAVPLSLEDVRNRDRERILALMQDYELHYGLGAMEDFSGLLP